MRTALCILDQRIELDCAPCEQRRLQNLADALEARLAGFSGDSDGLKRLALAALSLLDEAQAAGAALARAHSEIERLNDMLNEAHPGATATIADDERGRVAALRIVHGAP